MADIDACNRDWKAKGATFVIEPIDRAAEVRCQLTLCIGFTERGRN